MKFKAVIGLGFGDEGKGATTDWLCSQNSNALVIRYCGGSQAGHTVIKDRIRHIFANFGSGTLRDAPTYWSKYCPIDPIAIVNEFNVLKEKGITPRLYIDEECPVITLCDIQMNLWYEEKHRHGSCGVGVGTTLKREEDHCHLLYKDLFYSEIFKIKFDLIQKYYGYDYERTIRKEDLNEFLNCIEFITMNENIKIGYPEDLFDMIIFEGAQGLLLDQEIGFFPHVTRGNTGTKNILKIIQQITYDNVPEINLYLVTRAYQTRHGNGPMTNEDIRNEIKIPANETNKDNEKQGKFRHSLLDSDLLLYAINSDKYIKKAKNKTLIVTCIDHLDGYYNFTHNGKMVNCDDRNDFLDTISYILNIKHMDFLC